MSDYQYFFIDVGTRSSLPGYQPNQYDWEPCNVVKQEFMSCKVLLKGLKCLAQGHERNRYQAQTPRSGVLFSTTAATIPVEEDAFCSKSPFLKLTFPL